MSLHITPNGFFSLDMIERDVMKSTPVKKQDILTHLSNVCEIAEGTTLLNIFDAVDRFKELKYFISQYSTCYSIDEHHKQARIPLEKKDWDKTTDYLVINKYLGLHEGRKKNHYFSYHCSFSGMSNGKVESVSYCPLNEIADLPVKLDCSVVLKEPFSFKRPEEREFFRGTFYFTFLEVLDAIYDDISFIGSPEEKAGLVDEMKDRLDEYQSEIDQCELDQGEDS